MKICSRCKLPKALTEFNNDRSQKDGKTRRCKECQIAINKAWQEKDPERARAIWRKASLKHGRAKSLKHKYGITETEYEDRLLSQEGRCPICGLSASETKGRNPGRLNVDHDHETMVIRGLLCGPCNLILGQAHDDPNILLAAAAYLIRYSETAISV